MREKFYDAHIKCLTTLLHLNFIIFEPVKEDGTFENERDQELHVCWQRAINELNDLICFAKFSPKDKK